jgi:hypothetical protein
MDRANQLAAGAASLALKSTQTASARRSNSPIASAPLAGKECAMVPGMMERERLTAETVRRDWLASSPRERGHLRRAGDSMGARLAPRSGMHSGFRQLELLAERFRGYCLRPRQSRPARRATTGVMEV